MLKVFPVFRVTCLNLAGERQFFFFTNQDDADWFSSHFEGSFVDVVHQVSLTLCPTDDEKDSYLNLIYYGTGTFDK